MVTETVTELLIYTSGRFTGIRDGQVGPHVEKIFFGWLLVLKKRVREPRREDLKKNFDHDMTYVDDHVILKMT